MKQSVIKRFREGILNIEDSLQDIFEGVEVDTEVLKLEVEFFEWMSQYAGGHEDKIIYVDQFLKEKEDNENIG